MQKYADYIRRIEIDALWSGRKHIVWELNPRVNVLSGINGVGKSTILNKVVRGLAAGGEFPSHMLKGVRLEVEPADARWIRYDMIRSLDSNLQQTLTEGEGFIRQALSALAGVGGRPRSTSPLRAAPPTSRRWPTARPSRHAAAHRV